MNVTWQTYAYSPIYRILYRNPLWTLQKIAFCLCSRRPPLWSSAKTWWRHDNDLQEHDDVMTWKHYWNPWITSKMQGFWYGFWILKISCKIQTWFIPQIYKYSHWLLLVHCTSCTNSFTKGSTLIHQSLVTKMIVILQTTYSNGFLQWIFSI